MAIILNIQLFGEDQELAGNPQFFNQMRDQFDEGANEMSKIFESNAEIMATLKTFAGSQIVSEDIKPLVQSLSNLTEETSNYIDSADRWSGDVVSNWDNLVGATGAMPFEGKINPQVLENMQNEYNGYMGIRNSADVDDFIGKLQNEVVAPASNQLEAMISAVDGAGGALPGQIRQAFGMAVQRNNEAIRDSIDNSNKLISERLDSFRQGLQKWVDSASSAANGGN